MEIETGQFNPEKSTSEIPEDINMPERRRILQETMRERWPKINEYPYILDEVQATIKQLVKLGEVEDIVGTGKFLGEGEFIPAQRHLAHKRGPGGHEIMDDDIMSAAEKARLTNSKAVEMAKQLEGLEPGSPAYERIKEIVILRGALAELVEMAAGKKISRPLEEAREKRDKTQNGMNELMDLLDIPHGKNESKDISES